MNRLQNGSWNEKSRAIRCANEILSMDPNFMFFLSFPFISSNFKTISVKKWYEDVLRQMNLESIENYAFDNMCYRFQGRINAGENFGFSYFYSREAIRYILDSEYIEATFKNKYGIDNIQNCRKVRENFCKMLSILIEDDAAAWSVAKTIFRYFDMLPAEEIQSLLFNGTEKYLNDKLSKMGFSGETKNKILKIVKFLNSSKSIRKKDYNMRIPQSFHKMKSSK